MEELKRHLHEYDTGSWTRYDLVGTMASVKYHKVHIWQMKKMYELTGDEIFLKYYEKWKSYSENPWNILTKKIFSLRNVAVYGLNAFVIFIALAVGLVLKRYK